MRNPGRSDDGGARPEGADARATHQAGGVGTSAESTVTGSLPEVPPDCLVDVAMPDIPVPNGVLAAPASTVPSITVPSGTGPADAAPPHTGPTSVPHLDEGDSGDAPDAGVPDAADAPDDRAPGTADAPDDGAPDARNPDADDPDGALDDLEGLDDHPDDLLFDPLLSDEPIDLAAVLADDALIDALGSGDLDAARGLVDPDDPLIAMLAAWAESARTVEPEPEPSRPVLTLVDNRTRGPADGGTDDAAAQPDERPDGPVPLVADDPAGTDTGVAVGTDTGTIAAGTDTAVAAGTPGTPIDVAAGTGAAASTADGVTADRDAATDAAPATPEPGSIGRLVPRPLRRVADRRRGTARPLPPGHPLRRAAVAAVVALLGLSGAAAAGSTARPGDAEFAMTRVFYAERARSLEAAEVVSDGLRRAREYLDTRQTTLAAQELERVQRVLPTVREEEGHQLLETQQDILNSAVALAPAADPLPQAGVRPGPRNPDTSVLAVPAPGGAAPGSPAPSGGVAAAPVPPAVPGGSTIALGPPPQEGDGSDDGDTGSGDQDSGDQDSSDGDGRGSDGSDRDGSDRDSSERDSSDGGSSGRGDPDRPEQVDPDQNSPDQNGPGQNGPGQNGSGTPPDAVIAGGSGPTVAGATEEATVTADPAPSGDGPDTVTGTSKPQTPPSSSAPAGDPSSAGAPAAEQSGEDPSAAGQSDTNTPAADPPPASAPAADPPPASAPAADPPPAKASRSSRPPPTTTGTSSAPEPADDPAGKAADKTPDKAGDKTPDEAGGKAPDKAGDKADEPTRAAEVPSVATGSVTADARGNGAVAGGRRIVVPPPSARTPSERASASRTPASDTPPSRTPSRVRTTVPPPAPTTTSAERRTAEKGDTGGSRSDGKKAATGSASTSTKPADDGPAE